MIILTGQDYARAFFGRADNSLSIRDGLAFLSRLFGRDFYSLAETSEYRRQRERHSTWNSLILIRSLSAACEPGGHKANAESVTASAQA